MTKEVRKKQLALRTAALLAALVVIAGLVIFLVIRFVPSGKHMDAASYFGVSEGRTPVVADGKVLSGKSIENGPELYLDLEDVSASVNSSFFYEDTEDLLIVSAPREVYKMSLSGGRTGNGEAVREDESIGVSLSFLERMTDAVFDVYEDPHRVVIRTEHTLPVMTFSEDAPIRQKAGIRSPIVKDCKQGETVFVPDYGADGSEKEGKAPKWTRVYTEDGFAGYVEDRFLTGLEVSETAHRYPAGEYTKLLSGEPLNIVFHQTTDQASNNALEESLEGVEGVNVIAPTWFFMDGGGDLTSLASESYVETAHERGLGVWAVLNDFDGMIASPADTSEALSSDANRSALIDTVTEEIVRSGADGLIIDIELVREGAAADYAELIRELSSSMRREGKVLAVCTYVPRFTKYLNRPELSKAADYIIVMCYDENTAGSKKAGSVSSLPFVKRGITDTIREVPKEQVIAALPFFTRLWETDADGSVSSKSYGMSAAASRMEELQMSPSFDEQTGQNYAEKKSGDTLFQIWVEDAASLGERREAVRDAGCAGIAEWKLGLETPDVWEVLEL